MELKQIDPTQNQNARKNHLIGTHYNVWVLKARVY